MGSRFIPRITANQGGGGPAKLLAVLLDFWQKIKFESELEIYKALKILDKLFYSEHCR
jgi:hypothetical protein